MRSIIKYEEKDICDLITVGNSARAIKRIIKKRKNDTIVINNNSADESNLKGCIIKYNELSIEASLKVIEKICRQVAAKHNIKIPFEDLYLYASPETAYKFIEKLMGMSRIFTVVTDMPLEDSSKSLYLEHGCLTRHIKRPNEHSCESVSFFIESCGIVDSPVVNLTDNEIQNEKVTDVRKVSVSDPKMAELKKHFSGVCGLPLYTLTGLVPEENSTVDINKKADSIFLLDTSAI